MYVLLFNVRLKRMCAEGAMCVERFSAVTGTKSATLSHSLRNFRKVAP